MAVAWLARQGRYVAAGLVLLGLAVRLRHYLAAPSYWYDEAYLLLNVFDKSFAELAGPLRGEQAAPPLFLWSLRALYLSVGRSEWAMRLPAFAASVLAVLVMVPLARRFAGPPGWLWAVGFVAVSQTALFHTVSAKPYAGDLLAVELASLAGVVWLAGDRAARPVGLLAAALLLPWWSYPSVFALGGVTLGIACAAIRRRSFRDGIIGGIFSLTWALSFAAVWLAAGRHQRSDSLADYWRPFFLDCTSFRAALSWLFALVLRLGNYATTGMGLPLLILAVIGTAQLARRTPELLALPLGMFTFAVITNALHFYPLEDRLLYFAAPGLWLLAAAGAGTILQQFPGRRSWLLTGILALVLVPGTVRYVYWLAVVPSKVEFREAFAYVEAKQTEGDVWWVSHSAVFEIYRGKNEHCLSGPLTAEDLCAHCRGQRLWVVIPPGWDEPAPFRELGYELVERQEFRTLHVLLFQPTSRR